MEPHLAPTHPQYPDGFPARVDDRLLGHWRTPDGFVVVENHPHGYEIHFYPCYDFARCDACSPDRGESNPNTDDGHHFRLCATHGPILTVAGGEAGYRTVLEYLAAEKSEPHVRELAEAIEAERAEEAAAREQERIENEAAIAEAAAAEPSYEERLAAVEAELAALREIAGAGSVAQSDREEGER